MSTSGHPLLKLIIDHTVNNIERRYFPLTWNKGTPCLDIKGPIVIGRCVEKYLEFMTNKPGSFTHQDGTKYLILKHEVQNSIQVIVDENNNQN